MKSNENNVPEKSKKTSSSIVLYVAGSIVALFAVVLLIINIMVFKDIVPQVNEAMAQGVTLSSILPQVLPPLLEPIAVYGGIALLLFYVGIINQKVSESSILLTEAKGSNDSTGQRVAVEKTTETTYVDPIKQEETFKEDNEALNDNK